MIKKSNPVEFSDSAINSIPNSKQFMNNIYYFPNIEKYNMDLNDINFKDGQFKKYIQSMKVYFKKSNYYYDNEYHYFDQSYGEHLREVPIDSENNIVYRLNSNLFRSDHFITNHSGKHLLFAGCSETFGEGGNIEDNWSYKVYKSLLETNNLSGYFNVSLPGAGWEQIMHNIKRYIIQFGSPDILIIFAPNMLRYFKYYDKDDEWRMHTKNIPFKYNKEYTDTYADKFVFWLFSIQNFIDYCEALGIKVIWSTWASQENTNIIRTQYFEDSFFPTWNISIEQIIGDYSKEDLSRRDGHHGNIYHTHVANSFMHEIVKRNYLNPPREYVSLSVKAQIKEIRDV